MNTTTETCPSLEDLAAFLEGKLSGNERAQVVSHLADCPDCYEVFAEAARFQLEEEVGEVPQEGTAPEGPAKVILFPRKQVFHWAASTAAAAALAVGIAAVPTLHRQYNTVPELTAATLVSPAVTGKVAANRFGDRYRGSSEEEGAFSSSSEFLLGAYVVDLHLSLQGNDRHLALDDLASINRQMNQLSFLPDQAQAYRAIQTQIDAGKQPKDFVLQAASLESELDANFYSKDISYRDWVPETLVNGILRATKGLFHPQEPSYAASYLAFGKWAEAGRLSALAKSPKFFQSPDSRKFPRALLYEERENLDPEVVKDLEAIRQALDRPDPSSLPYEDLRGQFESILKHYQEESTKSGLP